MRAEIRTLDEEWPLLNVRSTSSGGACPFVQPAGQESLHPVWRCSPKVTNRGRWRPGRSRPGHRRSGRARGGNVSATHSALDRRTPARRRSSTRPNGLPTDAGDQSWVWPAPMLTSRCHATTVRPDVPDLVRTSDAATASLQRCLPPRDLTMCGSVGSGSVTRCGSSASRPVSARKLLPSGAASTARASAGWRPVRSHRVWTACSVSPKLSTSQSVSCSTWFGRTTSDPANAPEGRPPAAGRPGSLHTRRTGASQARASERPAGPGGDRLGRRCPPRRATGARAALPHRAERAGQHQGVDVDSHHRGPSTLTR